MTSCFLSAVIKNRVKIRLPLKYVVRQVQWVMGPWEFRVLSTFLTGMGRLRGKRGNLFFLAKFMSMNWPSAPESMSACVETGSPFAPI